MAGQAQTTSKLCRFSIADEDFERLERYAGKLARTVLRGERQSNLSPPLDLPYLSFFDMRM